MPGSHYVYVGGSDGMLHEIDLLGRVLNDLPLLNGTVGAPSLDRGYTPALLHVGTEAGVFYAVQVPLPGGTCVSAPACSGFNVGQPCYVTTAATECLVYYCQGAGVCSP